MHFRLHYVVSIVSLLYRIMYTHTHTHFAASPQVQPLYRSGNCLGEHYIRVSSITCWARLLRYFTDLIVCMTILSHIHYQWRERLHLILYFSFVSFAARLHFSIVALVLLFSYWFVFMRLLWMRFPFSRVEWAEFRDKNVHIRWYAEVAIVPNFVQSI